jgi:SMC interacting uncharacterized protein involved in chromosome segregation
MSGELKIKLSKEAYDDLQNEATNCGISIEDYAEMVLSGKKPRLLELTDEEKKELKKTVKSMQSMAFKMITKTN